MNKMNNTDATVNMIVKKLRNYDELLEACKLSQRWFEKLTEDKDFVDLDVSLCRLLNQAKGIVEQAIEKAENN